MGKTYCAHTKVRDNSKPAQASEKELHYFRHPPRSTSINMDRYSKKWVFTYNTKDAEEPNSRAAALAVTAHIETFAQNECDWLIVELEQGGLEKRWHL